MPMLSFSHRTTAPAMATEPWEETRQTRITTGLSDSGWPLQCRGELKMRGLMKSFTHLECVAGGLLFSHFVGDCGQQAVVRHHRLRESEKKNRAWRNRTEKCDLKKHFPRDQHLTFVPVFLSRKQPVPYLHTTTRQIRDRWLNYWWHSISSRLNKEMTAPSYQSLYVWMR